MVVGIFGCVIDYFEWVILDLLWVDFLVFDEVDEMLIMGFVDDVECILFEIFEYK